MSLQEITERELSVCGVVSLPTRPGASREFGGRSYTPAQVKEAFDRLPRLIAERYNQLVNAVDEGEFAESLMVTKNGEMVTLRNYLEDMLSRLQSGEEKQRQLESTQGDILQRQALQEQMVAEIETFITDIYESLGADLALLASQEEQIQIDIRTLYAIAKDTVVVLDTIEDTFSTRITAGGISVIDDALSKVRLVKGNTYTSDNGDLTHATFEGILSKSNDDTSRDQYLLSKPVTLGKFDHIDVEKQEITRRTYTFTVTDESYGTFNNVTSFGSQGNYYVSFAFSGLPTVIKEEMSKIEVVSNYYPTASVSTNTNKKCIMYSTVASSGASAPRFDFRDDELIVFKEDGSVNKEATIAAFQARFAEVGLQIAYRTGEVQSIEPLVCPTQYCVWNGGSETVLPIGQTVTITQDYYVKAGGGES